MSVANPGAAVENRWGSLCSPQPTSCQPNQPDGSRNCCPINGRAVRRHWWDEHQAAAHPPQRVSCQLRIGRQPLTILATPPRSNLPARPSMRTLIVRFLLTASFFCTAAVSLTLLLRDELFHSVPARCVEGGWEAGAASRRGFAFLRMQYEWQGQVYETLRTFGPLDDSPRKREWPEDVQRGHEWIAANCRDQPAQVMHGLPSIAWFGDERGWNSVLVGVVLRALVAAALFSAAWTSIRLARTTRLRSARG